jgi:protein O-GlcNAc transferase
LKSLETICSEAMKLQIAGRLDLAEPLYREVLHTDSRHPVANHCLGMLHLQSQRTAGGLPHLLTALEVRPENPDYWLGYLEALLLMESWDEAQATLNLARQRGLAGSAVDDYSRRLFAALPVAASAPFVPAPAPSRAERRRTETLARKQEDGLLGLIKQQRFADARTLAGEMTGRFPDRGLGWKVLGAMQWADKRIDDAIVSMQTAARLLPDDAETHCNLAAALIKANRLAEAESVLVRAQQIAPESRPALVHLSDALQLQGRYAEAETHIRRAIALSPDDGTAESQMIYSTLLFILSHDPVLQPAALFVEHQRVGDHFEARRRAAWTRQSNDPDPARVLQVGIVSGDFFNHAVAFFIEPMLEKLQHYAGLELHAYYTNDAEDAVTSRLRGYFRHWTSVARVPDLVMVNAIKTDRIDILIDLAGHTALNRLPVFAHKPAPLQISWLGYPGTTGLRSMDYFLTDRHWLPPGEFDQYFTEKLVYLPAAAPARPSEEAPPVNESPALRTGFVTFGSFNRVGKISAATLTLWSDVLRAAPSAKMLIVGIPSQEIQDRLVAHFTAAGVAGARLLFHPRTDMRSYLSLHHAVDICLDTYPYSGGTTNLHAAWMGVPTLTVAGRTPATRQGTSIAGQLGLERFAAASVAEYVSNAVYWTHHLPELAAVRAGLRQRLQASPSRHPGLIAEALERAMRRMWRRWCANLPTESFDAVPASDG